MKWWCSKHHIAVPYIDECPLCEREMNPSRRMKHGNPFKERGKSWLNPSRRDNIDITKLRKRYGNGE